MDQPPPSVTHQAVTARPSDSRQRLIWTAYTVTDARTANNGFGRFVVPIRCWSMDEADRPCPPRSPTISDPRPASPAKGTRHLRRVVVVADQSCRAHRSSPIWGRKRRLRTDRSPMARDQVRRYHALSRRSRPVARRSSISDDLKARQDAILADEAFWSTPRRDSPSLLMRGRDAEDHRVGRPGLACGSRSGGWRGSPVA